MDWKSLATDQRQQLERSNATIDELNRELTARNKEISNLRFELIEQNETLGLAAQTSNTNSTDRISKLQLLLKIAEGKRDDLAEAAGLSASRELELRRQITEKEKLLQTARQSQMSRNDDANDSNSVTKLEANLQKAEAEKQKLKELVSRLQKQIEAEAKARLCAPDKSHDQDDEEGQPRPGPPQQQPSRQQSAYGPASISQLPFGFRQSAQSATGPFATPPASLKPPTQAKQSFVKTSAPASAPLSIPVRTKSVAQKAPLMLNKAAPGPKPQPTTKKAPVKNEASQRATGGKLKRSFQQEIDEEMANLDPKSFEEVSTPRKKQRQLSLAEQLANGPEFEQIDAGMEFKFKAVTSWAKDGEVIGFDSKLDIAEVLAELWERINDLREQWEEAKGEDWQYEFTKSGYNQKATHCVTKKMAGGRKVLWRSGCEGKYACGECVAANRPCFTYNATMGDFLLLPLHEEDRRLKVEKKKEIRYWVNS